MTTFTLVKMTGVIVNLKTGEITLTAKVSLNDENFRKAEQLQPYLGEDSRALTLEITSSQMSLPEPAGKGKP